MKPMTPDEVRQNTVAGQYGPARIGGEDVPGFPPGARRRPEFDHRYTYAAVTLFVENWRWAGVPFYLRTGKRLPKRVTEIAIQFNRRRWPSSMARRRTARPIC
jgi:glucose-6-phosphate 1-dehydrogenase